MHIILCNNTILKQNAQYIGHCILRKGYFRLLELWWNLKQKAEKLVHWLTEQL